MSSSAVLSRLTLGVAATASTASGAIVVFDFPDVTYDDHFNDGTLEFSAINLQTGLFDANLLGASPKFVIGTEYSYFVFTGDGSVKVDGLFKSSGDLVGSGLTFSPTFYDYGFSVPSGTVYLGLSLTNGAATHYGWFEIVSTEGTFNGQNVFTFTRFAFNDVAGESILAGQTAAVPEASTLGLVGGLFGLVAAAHVRRRRQQQAAASDTFLALAAGEKLN